MAQEELKYLWVAEMATGETIRQTPNDVSKTDPKRNCYWDLLQYLKANKQARIRKFSIVSRGKGAAKGNTITVDLGNGIFFVNGLPLLVEAARIPSMPDRFDLIWFHRVTKELDSEHVADKKGIFHFKKDLEVRTFREYFIGWECTVAGKHYEQKIGVA